MRSTTTTLGRLALAGLLLVGVAACGDGDDGDDAAAGGDETEAATEGPLTGVCPEKVIIQTSWFPEAEYGPVYDLAVPGGTRDAGSGSFSGPLGDTGVDVEIRAGGPFLGDASVTSNLYEDQDILLGIVATDQTIQTSTDFPTKAVFSYFEKAPTMLMYDPATYDFETIEDVRDAGARILHFSDETAIDYLSAAGQLDPGQLDASYDGAPDRFIAAQGEDLIVGFVSSEPYRYENEYEQWGKPVESLLLHDAGFQPYGQSLVARPEVVEEEADCLELLVPIIQQSMVDFMAEPDATLTEIRLLNEEIDDFWQTTDELNAEAVRIMAEEGIVANGPDGTVGSFDTERVDELIAQLAPVFRDAGVEISEDLAADDIVTNEFLDPSVSLPG